MSRKDRELDEILKAEAEDFDYLKEIEEIEAQERELEARRKLKIEEHEKKKNQGQKKASGNAAKSSKDSKTTQPAKSEGARKKERRELKKEAKWLGGELDASTEQITYKKKNKLGVVLVVLLLLLAIGGGGYYAYSGQMKRQVVASFETKVASFKSEKLDGVSLGSYQSYFDDFMGQCQNAIDDQDLKAIAALNEQWPDLESKLTEIANGRTSLDAFLGSVDEAFAKLYVTDEYTADYNKLMKEIEAVKSDLDYSKVADLQKRVDAMAINLKSADEKYVVQLQNKIKKLSLDQDYLTQKQKDKLAKFDADVNAALDDGDFKTAVQKLDKWRAQANDYATAIASKKAAEKAKAESEAESRAKEQSELESRRQSEYDESVKNEETKESEKPDNPSGGGYIFADSSSRYLSESEVRSLSSYQKMIARNEIYARHGYIFNDPDLKAYFSAKSWYKPTVSSENFSSSVFNAYEEANITLIYNCE